MKKLFTTQHVAAVVAAACLLGPGLGMAANHTAAAAPEKMTPGSASTDKNFSDRMRMKPWSDEKAQLESRMKLGEGKAFYAKALADNGYQITSINADKPDYVEYEVVKGNDSWEVQIDFDKAGAKASKVDVTSNLWRSDATKNAMKGTKTAAATKYMQGNEKYSERTRMKTWSSEKEKLEKSLALGNDKAYYVAQLKKMGYQVTSTNDTDKDSVEYEVVKGGDSYEVQINFDGGKAKKIDVTTNMWESDSTEKARANKKM